MRTHAAIPVRDRILAVASDLFYRQGYRATGINQVVRESGVAKASFYDHFASKADLLDAYARAASKREFEELKRDVMALPTARARFFGPLTVLLPWFESSDYRGCPFQNMMAEVAGEDPRILETARRHRESLRALFRELAQAWTAEEPRLAAADLDELVDAYTLLFEGAIAVAVAYRERWPVDAAVRALERLVGNG